jgi:hypothetical protein
MAFFLKYKVMIKLLLDLAVFWIRNANFLTKIFKKSVPGTYVLSLEGKLVWNNNSFTYILLYPSRSSFRRGFQSIFALVLKQISACHTLSKHTPTFLHLCIPAILCSVRCSDNILVKFFFNVTLFWKKSTCKDLRLLIFSSYEIFALTKSKKCQDFFSFQFH